MTAQPETTEPEAASPAPAPTQTLGSLLRRARQDKRVALEVAAKDTRIHATTLTALEEDDRGALPAEVFTRGFIKIYAQYLGLDPNQALQMYLDHRGETTAIPDEKVNAQEVLAGETMAEPPSFHAERHLFTAAVVILITLILYLGYKITAPPEEEPVPVAPISAAEPQLPPPPAEPTAEAEVQPTPDGLPPALPATEAAPPQPLPAPAITQPSQLPPAPAALPAVPTQTAPLATTGKPAAPALAPPAATPPATLPKPALPTAPAASHPTPARTLSATPHPTAPVAVAPAPAARTALPPATLAQPPTPSTAAKPPLKELVPDGPIKKEKTTTAPAPATEKSAREPNTAEKLIAAIKPMRPPYALDATFREDTWVRIQVDGEKPKPQYFRAGDKASWQAGSKIQLFIGNAGGVDLTLNNTKLPPLGKAGNTTRITIQPQSDQR